MVSQLFTVIRSNDHSAGYNKKEFEAILQDLRDQWVPTLLSHCVSKIDKALIHMAKWIQLWFHEHHEEKLLGLRVTIF